MEIEIFPEMKAFVNIFNEKIEYEVEAKGRYTEFEATRDNITNQLLSLYNSRKNGIGLETQPVL